VLHVLLTGETGGYYADYADDPAGKLARCLAEGWVYQGEPSEYLGQPRGEPSHSLPPTAHVLFLQNHDQTGNRAFGERLTVLADPAALEAAIALQMLCPQIPLLFMGEEDACTTPFLFFTDHSDELAEAVREGRRAEFARFAAFADPEQRARIPDPNAESTFLASVPRPDAAHSGRRRALYKTLIELRRNEIIPRLQGAVSLDARPIGAKAVYARWRMGDGAILSIAINLDEAPVDFHSDGGTLLFASIKPEGDFLPGRCTLCFLQVM
jgi:maltooligosyltrehalose trehalohydrolase